MDILYAPWRDRYVKNNNKSHDPTSNSCVFCAKVANPDADAQEYILKRTQHAFVILNLYPYNGGHLLILPNEHVANLHDLTPEIRAEIMELVSASTVILQQVLQAHGINVGINLGSASGAGIPEHLHLHLVPRWSGDTSFITVIGNTKNVSVDLQKIYTDIKPAFDALKI